MKKTLVTLGMGACVLMAFTSCRSTDYENAVPMDQYSVADGEIPPWLLDGNEDEGQVAAGPTTHNRNTFPTPDEGATADATGAGRSSQVQPSNIATTTPPADSGDTVVETPSAPNAVAVNDTPTASSPVTTPTKPKKTSKPKPTKPQGKKPKKKFTEPTLITYTVRKGDNLYDIAQRSRTSVAQIKKDSKLKGDTIYPGQVIKVRYIPKGYKPSKNNAGSSSSAKPRTHVVAKGETISGIAKRYGVPTTQVLKANGLSAGDAARIRPGKRLTIPAASTGKATAKNTGKGKNNKKKKK